MGSGEAGWRPYPGAYRAPHDLPPVKPGRVVGLGAVCDLAGAYPEDASTRSFIVSEFAMLHDGRRVLLHAERGFTVTARSTGAAGNGAVPLRETRDSITQHVLNAVLPDDEECAEEHLWSWLAELAQARGLAVTAEDLRALPYRVVLTDAVSRWLAPA
ncbi:hypothetical protein [Micromonospora sp. CV4]|uniref:hypothetical protein n=1 Tax=Micromonospora sp. CV4 TaxID=2478711 RepID=UPI000EF53C59|nr:hypothetical protein [Micromonospora sp. CV4]RLP93450.1 hypothetical protein EAD98_18970 [Micromonospora sp. CV4]